MSDDIVEKVLREDKINVQNGRMKTICSKYCIRLSEREMSEVSTTL